MPASTAARKRICKSHQLAGDTRSSHLECSDVHETANVAALHRRFLVAIIENYLPSCGKTSPPRQRPRARARPRPCPRPQHRPRTRQCSTPTARRAPTPLNPGSHNFWVTFQPLRKSLGMTCSTSRAANWPESADARFCGVRRCAQRRGIRRAFIGYASPPHATLSGSFLSVFAWFRRWAEPSCFC